jgi:hypothetical protein
MRKIEICGEQVEVGFCMAVEIAYEEMTDTVFDIKALERRKNALALGLAAIITYNKECGVTMDKLLNEATAQDIATLTNAVVEEMLAWMKIPATAEKEADKDDGGEEKRD